MRGVGPIGSVKNPWSMINEDTITPNIDEFRSKMSFMCIAPIFLAR
jgi:hypothetical protein